VIPCFEFGPRRSRLLLDAISKVPLWPRSTSWALPPPIFGNGSGGKVYATTTDALLGRFELFEALLLCR
jgi:hypothetical protein